MADYLNPGCIDPINQCYPAPMPLKTPLEPASAALVSSDGQMQNPSSLTVAAVVTGLGLPANVLAGTANQSRAQPPKIAQTIGKGLTLSVNTATASQVRARPPEAAQTTGKGLAANVQAGSASQVRASVPTPALASPPVVSVAVSTTPGGLPINVFVH